MLSLLSSLRKLKLGISKVSDLLVWWAVCMLLVKRLPFRLRRVINGLISPWKHAFMGGSSILDGALTASEVVDAQVRKGKLMIMWIGSLCYQCLKKWDLGIKEKLDRALHRFHLLRRLVLVCWKKDLQENVPVIEMPHTLLSGCILMWKEPSNWTFQWNGWQLIGRNEIEQLDVSSLFHELPWHSILIGGGGFVSN